MIMKKITLLVAGILLVGSVANAAAMNNKADEERRSRYSFDEPISFMERGIEFFVFPNGDFDFNTRPQDSPQNGEGTYYYKTAGKKGTTVTARGGAANYGVLIEQDRFGRVRRVGNTFINYDARDRVNRIGSVFMRYNRFALTQIGGMQLVYNRRGDMIDRIGSVKGRGNYGYTYNYYNHDDDNDEDHEYTAYNNNTDYYYYKSDGTRAKTEEDKERK